MEQWKHIQLVSMRMWVQSLALLSGLRIWGCCELWCRLQMRLGSHVAVAVAVASSYSSDSVPRLGTSYVSFSMKVLSGYAQEWDYWVIWSFYI